jgi:iron complex transport system substrate-binding protein
MPRRASLPDLRIVSLAPNSTSILLALGASRELVGVSKWCADVANVGSRPRLGDCWKLDLAEVMRLKPSLIIGSVPFAPAVVEQILAQPVAFLALNPRSLMDIHGDILTLGQLVGRAAAARALVQRMNSTFAEIRRRATHLRAHRPSIRVYSEAWPNPRISSPPWVAELVKLAGGRMVVPAGQRVADSAIAAANPQVIILAWTATADRAKPDTVLANRAWKHVVAVKNRRVVVIRDELLNTPGLPLVQGAWELLQALYPEAPHAAPRRLA